MSSNKLMKQCRKIAVFAAMYGANVARWKNTGYRLPARTIKRIRCEVLSAVKQADFEALIKQALLWKRGN